jgi:hypothetical protein
MSHKKITHLPAHIPAPVCQADTDRPAINLAAFRAFAGSFACEWELPALEAGGLGLQRQLTAASADAA